MTTYKLTLGSEIIKLPDKIAFPPNPANLDYQEYLAWVALGNTATAADPEGPQTDSQIAATGVGAWFAAHPNAALLFNLSITDLDTEIDSMAEALFPAASGVSNANKNRFKLWAKTVSHSVRALAKREGFTA